MPDCGMAVTSLALQMFNSQSLRRPSARVESVEFAGFGFPVNREEITAHPVHHGLGNAQNGIGGDSSVDRRSTFAQNFCARLRGLHVAGGNDAVPGNDHGAGGVTALGNGKLRAQDECEQDADWH